MPARLTRASSRRQDENKLSRNCVAKNVPHNSKSKRLPLADRTNSGSDENTSNNDNKKDIKSMRDVRRSKRAQKLPVRLADQDIVITPPRRSVSNITHTPNVPKTSETSLKSPSVTPMKRPHRVIRQPLRFEDNSLTPSKFIAIQPSSASTPIQNKKVSKTATKAEKGKTVGKKQDDNNNKKDTQSKSGKDTPVKVEKVVKQPLADPKPLPKIATPQSEKKQRSFFNLNTSTDNVGRNLNTREVKKKMAIYEFTFDPTEEPKVSKKVKRQVVKKKAAPRRVIIKDNYSRNVEKKLESLKNLISKKNPTELDNIDPELKKMVGLKSSEKQTVLHQPAIKLKSVAQPTTSNVEKITEPQQNDTNFDEPPLSYSPTPAQQSHVEKAVHNKDPLNLIEDLSFFDEVPVASSSMMSRRSVEASPWRVNCEVHRKWPAHVYVKANMTPAYEASFTNVDLNDSHEKSVLFNDNETGLKQTSILSFFREKAMKKAGKKSISPTKKAVTPTKNNSMFDDSHLSNNSEVEEIRSDINKAEQANVENTVLQDKNNTSPIKAPIVQKGKENKGVEHYFGFDDSINEDQENTSPRKIIRKVIKSKKVLEHRKGLSQMNQLKPTRANIIQKPATQSDLVQKLFEEMKSKPEQELPLVAEEPAIPENATSDSIDESDDDSEMQSRTEKGHSLTPVPLFEDIDVAHHDKPERKSYGKTRRVAFKQTTLHDYAESDGAASGAESDDSTYTVSRKKKPRRKKKELKEDPEAEAWAEQFNSMIEEADQFPLLIE